MVETLSQQYSQFSLESTDSDPYAAFFMDPAAEVGIQTGVEGQLNEEFKVFMQSPIQEQGALSETNPFDMFFQPAPSLETTNILDAWLFSPQEDEIKPAGTIFSYEGNVIFPSQFFKNEVVVQPEEKAQQPKSDFDEVRKILDENKDSMSQMWDVIVIRAQELQAACCPADMQQSTIYPNEGFSLAFATIKSSATLQELEESEDEQHCTACKHGHVVDGKCDNCGKSYSNAA